MAGVNVEALRIIRASDLEVERPEARWLVRHLWSRASVGIIGGQPKLGKSWFALDLAVSVASNTPCLGHFPVDDPGRALVYLAEDPVQQQRSRLDALCAHRGLQIEALDLHVLVEPVLRLDVERDRVRLDEAIARLKPKVLVLDPLVRLHRLDENSAQEISGLLSFLRALQRSHGVSIVLVHHASKKHRSRPGQALRGSSDIHAFGDDLAHLTATDDRELSLVLEHRSAASVPPLRLRLTSAPDGSRTHLELLEKPTPIPEVKMEPPEARLLDSLRSAPGPLTRQALRDALRINNQRLGDLLLSLERSNRVVRGPLGWTLTQGPAADADGQPRLL